MLLAEGLGPGLGKSKCQCAGQAIDASLADSGISQPLFLVKPCLGRDLMFVEYFQKANATLKLKGGRDTLAAKLLLHHLTYTQRFFHGHSKHMTAIVAVDMYAGREVQY